MLKLPLDPKLSARKPLYRIFGASRLLWKMLKRFNFFDKELLQDLRLPNGITCSTCLSTGVLLIGRVYENLRHLSALYLYHNL